MQTLSAIGLLGYGLTITFASFDWLMSLEPHWFSTIYGVLILGGQGLSALALLIAVIVWLSRRPPLDRIVVPSHLHDLGNLLLAFVMLWAYFSFSQFLIIWSGNLPQEITWYMHRTQTSWRYVGTALIAFHFAVPFLLLLSRTVKRHGDDGDEEDVLADAGEVAHGRLSDAIAAGTVIVPGPWPLTSGPWPLAQIGRAHV